jgi:hypothetical protein
MNGLRLPGVLAPVLGFMLTPLACGQAFTASASGGDGGGDGGGGTDSPVIDGSGGDDEGNPGDSGSQEGATDGGVPPADAPHEAPPGSIVYVSATSGNDANDGTDQTKPKKTIAAALTRAQSITSSPEVHVCKGVYDETGLSLTSTISLLGSYDCSTWQRTSTYGFPKFDKVDLTTIQNADPTTQAPTLFINGAVAQSALVDGFTITGAATVATATGGVAVAGSASPVLQNDVITGGSGVGPAGKPGSIGVAVIGGSPEIRLSVVSGGTGKGSVGSTGIALDTTGTPYVHDLVVSGGSGAASNLVTDTASVGILVANSMSQANAIKNVVVYGSDDGATGGTTAGISIGGTGLAVEVISSEIRGGDGAGGGTSSVGIYVTDPGGTVHVLQDRIFGGVRSVSGQSFGVFVTGVGVVSVENSEIHAGTSTAASVGVSIAGATSAAIVDDTIYTGAGGGSAIAIDPSQQAVVVTDDLLIGANATTGAAVNLGACGSSQLATLDHTAFVNFGTLYLCGGTAANSVAGMASVLPNASTAGDIEIGSGGACATASPPCVADVSCPGAPATCVPTVLGSSWTTTDDGVGGLFAGAPAAGSDAASPLPGWTLASPSWCALSDGGTPYKGIAQDLFGHARSGTTPTIGAYEYQSSVCN